MLVRFNLRFGALLMDIILYGVTFFLANAILSHYLLLDRVPEAYQMLISNILLSFYLLGEGLTGFTPGKLMLQIRIGKGKGEEGSVGFYLRRMLVKNPALVITVLYAWIQIIGYYEGTPLIDWPAWISGTIALLTVLFFISGCVAMGSHRLAIHDMFTDSGVFYANTLQKRVP